MPLPDKDWFTRYQTRVNSDPELGVIGKHFDARIALGMADARHSITVREGKITEFASNPKFDKSSDFTMRAPQIVWEKFLSAEPPPLYHDFFAMLMRVPEFVMEGNTLHAMQNARALHRMMNLMHGV